MLRQGGLFAPISREGALVMNNLFLVAACATVFVGTLYPLLLEMLTGDKISVGPPFFNWTFIPLALPLLFIVPFGQGLAWKRGDAAAAAQRLLAAFAVALVVGLAAAAMTWGGPVMAPIGLGIGAYLIIGSALEIWVRARGTSQSRSRDLGTTWRRRSACRARPGAPPWRMRASASRCWASPRRAGPRKASAPSAPVGK